MPALKKTKFTARIIWLGRVLPGTGLRSQPLNEAFLSFEGMEGEAHAGLTRPSCSRVVTQHPRGTPIRNTRQLSIVSAEELAATAQAMGLDVIDPAWVGASVVVEGLADLTHVPPSSRLQAPAGTTLVVDMENRPCVLLGREIEQVAAGFGARYKPAAKDRRGVSAWVEREGRLAVGDVLILHVPDQRLWAHHEATTG